MTKTPSRATGNEPRFVPGSAITYIAALRAARISRAGGIARPRADGQSQPDAPEVASDFQAGLAAFDLAMALCMGETRTAPHPDNAPDPGGPDTGRWRRDVSGITRVGGGSGRADGIAEGQDAADDATPEVATDTRASVLARGYDTGRAGAATAGPGTGGREADAPPAPLVQSLAPAAGMRAKVVLPGAAPGAMPPGEARADGGDVRSGAAEADGGANPDAGPAPEPQAASGPAVELEATDPPIPTALPPAPITSGQTGTAVARSMADKPVEQVISGAAEGPAHENGSQGAQEEHDGSRLADGPPQDARLAGESPPQDAAQEHDGSRNEDAPLPHDARFDGKSSQQDPNQAQDGSRDKDAALPLDAQQDVTGLQVPIAPTDAAVARGAHAAHGADGSEPSLESVTSDLHRLPGAGEGVIWMLRQCGIHSIGDLAASDIDDVRRRLGIVGQLIDLRGWLDRVTPERQDSAA